MIKKIKNFKISKKLIIFLVLFMFSSLLWFLNALNQEYNTEIRVPVEFYNLPKGKTNVSELPENLKVAVKAFGYSIFKFEMRKNFTQFKIDLSSATFSKMYFNDSTWFYSLSKEFIDQLDNQFAGDMKAEFIKPDTLYFHFTQLISKKVPVISNVKIVPVEQYILKDKVHFKPDSVVLKGSALALESINSIKTDSYLFENVSSNLSESINLQSIDGIIISPKKVLLLANIEEYTELNFKVNIKTINVPEDLKLNLFPSYVTVFYKVGISSYKNIKASDFEVIVDFKSIVENMGNKIETNVITYPSDVYSFYQTPEFVEYVVDKK